MAAAANIQSLQDVDFDELNYERWAPIVEARLKENGVWDVVVNGVAPDPTKIPEIAATITVVDLAQWRNRVIKDMKALKIIHSSLPESAFRKTVSVDSSKDLWYMLKEGNEQAKPRRLEKEFEKLMMYEGEPMDLYLDRVLDTVERFRRSGNPKSDDQVIAKLLTSLSSSYEYEIPVLKDIMNLHDMTLHDLLTIFEMFGSRPCEATAIMLKDFYISLKKAKSEQKWCGLCKQYTHNQEDCYSITGAVNPCGAKPFKGQCFQCGEKGHYARDCNTKNQTQAQVDPKKNQKAKHLMLTVVCGDLTFDEDMWMIYTASTDHMTPYVKFFTTLDRTYRAEVELANGSVIMAEGIGNVNIIMNGVKKTIKNVLFVPRLNRNILSFGKMAERGYSMEIGGGECTIWDETRKVFAKTVWEERGYALRLQVIEANFIS